MISLTRLSGSRFILNSDLIERVDATPDTVVTLVDGKKHVVQEDPAAIVTAVREHRAWIVALSSVLPATTPEPDLAEEQPFLAPVKTLPTNREA
ncbi:flagellar FlbD family protein [Nocardioides sp. AE5]|uniref:flagellar FlbD family protein n=1 Tax=Nocardioides sp. AE5 TaxID=2962573 RepID=UPI0028822851|nr:flagellar FlbD family protein [Nocardioides sp. AE5]MDT0200794.1 flagellar FlbD family protein [Nocardioides sp. AE5]